MSNNIVPSSGNQSPAPVPPKGGINFYKKLLDSISKATDSMAQQQVVDAKTTELDAGLQSEIFQYFTGPKGPLQSAANHIHECANKLASKNISTADQRKYNAELSEWQTKFQAAQTEYQGAQSQADSLIQSQQGITGQDSTNQKQTVELASALSQIGSYLANMLSSR